MQYFIGIDVSKAKLDVALLLANDKFKSKVFANNAPGFEALMQWMQLHLPDARTSLHLCMEATGSYHEALACFLSDQALVVSVVNPLLVKRFAEANRLRNKTDGGDAKCLAQFCRDSRPERWEAPSIAVRALQALVTRLDTLQTMRQAECNRLEVAHSSVADSVQQVIDTAYAVTGLDIPVRMGPQRPGDPPELVGNASHIRAELGWMPEHDLAEIVATAWRWHQKQLSSAS